MPAAQTPSRRKHTTFFLMLSRTGFDVLHCVQSCYGSVLKAFAVPNISPSLTALQDGRVNLMLHLVQNSHYWPHKRPMNSRRSRCTLREIGTLLLSPTPGWDTGSAFGPLGEQNEDWGKRKTSNNYQSVVHPAWKCSWDVPSACRAAGRLWHGRVLC